MCFPSGYVFATILATPTITSLLVAAGPLLVFLATLYAVHLTVVLGLGKALGFGRAELLVASNANIGGPVRTSNVCKKKPPPYLSLPSSLLYLPLRLISRLIIHVVLYFKATAGALCVGRGWSGLVRPALLVGNLGYSAANFIALAAFGWWSK